MNSKNIYCFGAWFNNLMGFRLLPCSVMLSFPRMLSFLPLIKCNNFSLSIFKNIVSVKIKSRFFLHFMKFIFCVMLLKVWDTPH